MLPKHWMQLVRYVHREGHELFVALRVQQLMVRLRIRTRVAIALTDTTYLADALWRSTPFVRRVREARNLVRLRS